MVSIHGRLPLDADRSLAPLLELAGHEVRVAHDGRAAVSLAQMFRPDTALLDFGVPERSGCEVAEALRRESWGTAVCLIALSGWGQEADQRRAHDVLRAGDVGCPAQGIVHPRRGSAPLHPS